MIGPVLNDGTENGLEEHQNCFLLVEPYIHDSLQSTIFHVVSILTTSDG